MTDLQQAGWRFVYRDGGYLWVHPSTKQKRDEDCTDMDDQQFWNFAARKQRLGKSKDD